MVYVTYILYLLVGFIIATIEATMIKGRVGKKDNSNDSSTCMSDRTSKQIAFALWILSLAPIIAQLYLISLMGGLSGYISSIVFRVNEWRGLGHILKIISTIYVINIIYFCHSLTLNKKVTSWWWFFYTFHFLILLTIGLLSGSRGGVAGAVFSNLIFYNFIRKKVTIKNALIFGIILLSVAFAIGVARTGYKYSDGEFSTGFSREGNQMHHVLLTFKIGLEPLSLIYEHDIRELQHGSTFLTGITNFVPRNLWPDKPLAATDIMESILHIEDWKSDKTTGIITEFIINFGHSAGLVLGMLCLLLLSILSVFIYRDIYKTSSSKVLSLKDIIKIYSYIIIIMTITSLTMSEYTNSIVIMISNLATATAIYLFIKLHSSIVYQIKHTLSPK
jgi:oligosaccharide repeat unit polymerase